MTRDHSYTMHVTTKTPKRPALRYHGGKWRLAPWIVSRFPRHRIYVEPFGGAASVLLRKHRSYAEVYNDLDDEVVNVFRILRDPENAHALELAIRLTPFARTEYVESFKRTKDRVELARRTIIRSFMGHGSNSINRRIKSGFRANAHRNGTTPSHDWANFPDAIADFVDRLNGVVIENRPAAEVIACHDGAETLFYLDPPYVRSTRTVGGRDHGYHHEMTDAEHEDLSAIVHQVKGMVVLSGYRCELYDRLFGDWHTEDMPARGDGACERLETLWFNPAARRRLSQRQLFDMSM